MAKQAVARTPDLEPIDRLEDKIKLLISMVASLRADQTKALADNERLLSEIDALRGRLNDAEGVSDELAVMRDEREVIRQRVAEMLSQLESI